MTSADCSPDTSIIKPFLILYPQYQNYPLPNLSTTPFMPPEDQLSTPSPSSSGLPSSVITPQQEALSRSSDPASHFSPAQKSLVTLSICPPTLSTPPTLTQKIIGICCVPYLNLRKRAKSSPAKVSHTPEPPPPTSLERSAPIGISSSERLAPTRIGSYESFPPPPFDLDCQPRALDSWLYPEEASQNVPCSARPPQTGLHRYQTLPTVTPNFSRPRYRESTTASDQYTSSTNVLTTTTTPTTLAPTSQPSSSFDRNDIPPIPTPLAQSLAQRPDATHERCHYRRPSCRARIPPKSPKTPPNPRTC